MPSEKGSLICNGRFSSGRDGEADKGTGYWTTCMMNLLRWFFSILIVLFPEKNGKPVSRKGQKIARSDFENLKSEYYQLRGWDVDSGLPKEGKLRELGLSDVARDLKARDLLK